MCSIVFGFNSLEELCNGRALIWETIILSEADPCEDNRVGDGAEFRQYRDREYVKFDTFTPAEKRRLPVTRVISRMTLQQVLARAVGSDIIMNESNVVEFNDDGQKVLFLLSI